MIFSAQQLFSDSQAVTTVANSTNVIDLGVPGTPYGGKAPLNRDVGPGTSIPLLCQVDTLFTAAGGATHLTIALETGSTTALNTIILSQTIAIADLVAGKQIAFDSVPNDILERYLGFSYTPVGGDVTFGAGKITAGITMGNQTNVTGP
jgi:hypothetical protein